MKKSKMHSPHISSFEDFKLERNKLNLNRKTDRIKNGVLIFVSKKYASHSKN